MDELTATQSLKIEGEPTKAFFVDLLTRDISLVDCILDLIDNSLHSDIRRAHTDVSNILLDKRGRRRIYRRRFRLMFLPRGSRSATPPPGFPRMKPERMYFGSEQPSRLSDDRGLGVYGIGMKRAIFKIGRKIAVHSSTSTEAFDVTIDVDKWKANANSWDFEFDPPGPQSNPDPATTGTSVIVSALNTGVAELFGQASFLDDLRARIAGTYSLFLKAGVSIELNNQSVKSELPPIAFSDQLKPDGTKRASKKLTSWSCQAFQERRLREALEGGTSSVTAE